MWPSTSNPVVASYDDDDARIKLVDYLQVLYGRVAFIAYYIIFSYVILYYLIVAFIVSYNILCNPNPVKGQNQEA